MQLWTWEMKILEINIKKTTIPKGAASLFPARGVVAEEVAGFPKIPPPKSPPDVAALLAAVLVPSANLEGKLDDPSPLVELAKTIVNIEVSRMHLNVVSNLRSKDLLD
jgi:hypothetical protein